MTWWHYPQQLPTFPHLWQLLRVVGIHHRHLRYQLLQQRRHRDLQRLQDVAGLRVQLTQAVRAGRDVAGIQLPGIDLKGSPKTEMGWKTGEVVPPDLDSWNITGLDGMK